MYPFKLSDNFSPYYIERKTILNGNKKAVDIAMIQSVYFYQPFEVNELKQLIKLLNNSLKNIDAVNLHIRNENERIENEMYKPRQSKTKEKPIPKAGYIYVAQCQITKKFKIGCSKDYKARINQLKISNPAIILIEAYKVDDMLFEKQLHDIFKEKKYNGEWFDLNEDDLGYLDIYVWRYNHRNDVFDDKIFGDEL